MERPYYLAEIEQHFRIHKVCGILGPRQVGKTTLARTFVDQLIGQKARFFDLENPRDLNRLLNNPMVTLEDEPEKLTVIDEIQMCPDLFPIIRVLVDDQNHKRKFLILGSASRDLIRQSSETLAGRIGYIELSPFSLQDTNEGNKLWIRGGYPLSFLAQDDDDSMKWRQNYIRTFLERDIPSLGFNIPPEQMRRFLLMLVHYHGQIFNASEIARSMAVSDHTSRRYLDILTGTFMVRILLPWFENLSKRQVKSPKIYFRDSGILHALLQIKTKEELSLHPRLGAFWEGFALEEIIREHNLTTEECFFWATQAGAELDLFFMKDAKRLGFEFKYADVPKVTKSMMIAMEDLKLDHLTIVHSGNQSFSLTENISAKGLALV